MSDKSKDIEKQEVPEKKETVEPNQDGTGSICSCSEHCGKVPAVFAAIQGVMKGLGAVEKDKSAPQFKYRGIDDVYNAVHKLFGEHGLFTTSEFLEEKTDQRNTKGGGIATVERFKMKYTFWASADGSSIDTVVIGSAMDTGDKAANKAMSVAHKYALLQMFCIPTEDLDDPDQDSYEISAFINDEQAATIQDLIERSGVPKDKVLAAYKAKSVGTILEDHYQKLCARLEKKIADAEKKTEAVA